MPVQYLRTISTWLKIALVCSILAIILFVTGFATVSWSVTHFSNLREQSIGLWKWKECNGYACRTSDIGAGRYQGYHTATQAMECLGLIGLFMGALILFLYVFADSCRRREAMLATILFLFGAVLFMVIGFCVFGTNTDGYRQSIGWSMGLAIAGCILTFIAGVMCLLHHLGK